MTSDVKGCSQPFMSSYSVPISSCGPSADRKSLCAGSQERVGPDEPVWYGHVTRVRFLWEMQAMRTPHASNIALWKEGMRQEWTAAAAGWRKWHSQAEMLSRAAT